MAGFGRFSSLTPARRNTLVGLVIALVITAAALVITSSGDDQQAVRTQDDATSTTDGSTTSTTEATTTTTEATTTTAPTTTAPATTSPPTTAAPPPPPPPSGPLDMAKVLTFAKGGGGGTAPQTFTGANQCPAHVDRPSDAGDNSSRDIDEWYLARYCDGVYRGVLATDGDTPALNAAWMRFDTKSGGCQGTDYVVIGWHTTHASGGTGGGGAVVATPRCDQGSWDWVEPAGFPVFNGAWLQLDFRGSAIGNPGSFDWRGFVQGVGESGSAIDVVPNSGPEHFVV